MVGVYRRPWRLPPRRRWWPYTKPGAGVPPSNTLAPVASGTAQQGQTVSTTDGTWAGDPVITFSYQWQRDVAGNLVYSNIVGAAGYSYILDPADVGCHVRCVVTGQNVTGNSSANSNALGLVTAGPAPIAGIGQVTDSAITDVRVQTGAAIADVQTADRDLVAVNVTDSPVTRP